MSARALLASPLGFLIGLSLGALGGGGSILAVPVLVYVAGQSATAATATSLVLVGLTSLVGLVPSWRAGRVDGRAGVLFGVAGIAATVAGTALNRRLDDDVLLLAFAGVMVLAGWRLWTGTRAGTAGTSAGHDSAARTAPRPAGAAVAAPVPTAPAWRWDAATLLRVLAAGSVVGFLTGLFGVGGGFVIVPALVLALRFPMPIAVGTSLLVIVINSVVALASRLGAGGIEWGVVAPFALSSIAGVVVGVRIAGNRSPIGLQRAFVVLLAAVAAYTAVRSAVAIWG